MRSTEFAPVISSRHSTAREIPSPSIADIFPISAGHTEINTDALNKGNR
jgi:hypothetical protein